MNFTPDWAVETYLDIREQDREDKKSFDERHGERARKMEMLEKFLLQTMVERNEVQIKTAAGTAYKSPQMRCVMKDREQVVAFVLDPLTSIMHPDRMGASVAQELAGALERILGRLNLFTNHVQKEVVKGFLDEGVPVDGIDVQTFTACNIRKA